MHKAALRNHLGIMISLSPEGPEIGAVNDAHQSPHHLAANKGCVEAVITLQNAKTDFKVRGRLIRTLLYSSVAAHQMSVVNCLLAEPHIEAGRNIYPPRHIASLGKDFDLGYCVVFS